MAFVNSVRYHAELLMTLILFLTYHNCQPIFILRVSMFTFSEAFEKKRHVNVLNVRIADTNWLLDQYIPPACDCIIQIFKATKMCAMTLFILPMISSTTFSDCARR